MHRRTKVPSANPGGPRSDRRPADASLAAGLRDKLRALGPSALSDLELLAVLLGPTSRGHSMQDVCSQLLPLGSELASLIEASAEDLARCPGLGRAAASRIAASLEIARRLGRSGRRGGRNLDHPERVHALLAPRLSMLREEHVLVLLLDARHRCLGERTISKGSLMASVIHPREVFRPALTLSAASIILVHNHPSGDPTPSAEDHEVTERIAVAGSILGIQLLDHVIVAADGYCSFRESGWLEPRDLASTRPSVASTLPWFPAPASSKQPRSPDRGRCG